MNGMNHSGVEIHVIAELGVRGVIRYGALKSLGERKACFNEYLQQRKRDEKEESRQRCVLHPRNGKINPQGLRKGMLGVVLCKRLTHSNLLQCCIHEYTLRVNRDGTHT